jgi:hypothetical protein
MFHRDSDGCFFTCVTRAATARERHNMTSTNTSDAISTGQRPEIPSPIFVTHLENSAVEILKHASNRVVPQSLTKMHRLTQNSLDASRHVQKII